MQKIQQLYERVFGESLLYFYRNRSRFSDWQAVVIYPSRATEQDETHPYRALLNSDQVHRIYLNELGPMEELPLGVATMVLTIVTEDEAPEQARRLVQRVKQEVSQPLAQDGIIEIIDRILVYKFTHLSPQEISDMLATNVEDIRAFREIKEEERKTIARNLLRKNLDVEMIVEVTGLTLQQVQQLKSENQ